MVDSVGVGAHVTETLEFGFYEEIHPPRAVRTRDESSVLVYGDESLEGDVVAQYLLDLVGDCLDISVRVKPVRCSSPSP